MHIYHDQLKFISKKQRFFRPENMLIQNIIYSDFIRTYMIIIIDVKIQLNFNTHSCSKNFF